MGGISMQADQHRRSMHANGLSLLCCPLKLLLGSYLDKRVMATVDILEDPVVILQTAEAGLLGRRWGWLGLRGSAESVAQAAG